LARQPVFNKKQGAWAYQFKFYPELEISDFEAESEDNSSFVLSNGFLSADSDTLSRGKLALISFNKELLTNEIPLLFPKDRLLVEVAATVDPDDSVAATLAKLKADGYKLIFDARIILEGLPDYLEIADFVKVNFKDASEDDLEQIRQTSSQFQFKLLADNLETREKYATAQELGFQYFCGAYFSQPEIVPGKSIPGRQMVHLQLISELNQPDLSRTDLENIFKQDVSLSYKLLTYINSAHFGIRNEIKSLKHAISMLGFVETKRLLTLLILGNLVSKKSEELLVTAIVRANLAEMVGDKLGMADKKHELFLMGMFSVLDTLLDHPLEAILANLPIAPEIKSALSAEPGLYKDIYDLVLFAENGHWHAIFSSVEKLGLKKYDFLDMSLKAIRDANPIIGE